MGYINEVLNDEEEIDYGFEGGPEYNTEIVDLDNSLEARDAKWLYPKHRYSASFSAMDDPARDNIIEVFHACRGRAHSFKFKDWNDYLAVDEPLIVQNGTMNPVQLYKTYNFGEAFTIRPVQAVRSDAVVMLSGVPVGGVLDINTGMFTPSVNWTAGSYTWTGEFYVWVRFVDDYNALTIEGWRNNAASVELIEDKRPITATNVPLSWDGE